MIIFSTDCYIFVIPGCVLGNEHKPQQDETPKRMLENLGTQDWNAL